MFRLPLTRRAAMQGFSSGLGYLMFARLSAMAADRKSPLAPKPPHFKARAKSVIFLYMHGGPSHVDTFDFKPRLAEKDGKASSKPGRIPGRSCWLRHGSSVNVARAGYGFRISSPSWPLRWTNCVYCVVFTPTCRLTRKRH